MNNLVHPLLKLAPWFHNNIIWANTHFQWKGKKKKKQQQQRTNTKRKTHVVNAYNNLPFLEWNLTLNKQMKRIVSKNKACINITHFLTDFLSSSLYLSSSRRSLSLHALPVSTTSLSSVANSLLKTNAIESHSSILSGFRAAYSLASMISCFGNGQRKGDISK